MSFYKNCRLCPRECAVDREAGQIGFCGETSLLRIAFAGIHKGEEPPVTGSGGSGTIFVSGCNLGCVFCQNYQISQSNMGAAVTPEEFSAICISLQEKNAENINIVTGSHTVPALAQGINTAKKNGLNIPVLWNSSGYEGKLSLGILDDFVDVYLPDLKTLDSDLAKRFFNAPGYPEYSAAAILEMIKNRKLKLIEKNESEILVSGVMIRHLVIPGYMDSTRKVLKWFSENCRGKALLSLMTQYTPVDSKSSSGKAPDRFVSENEYEILVSMLDEFDIDDGYCQELVTGSDWLPDFNRENPFSSDLSVPVWHF